VQSGFNNPNQWLLSPSGMVGSNANYLYKYYKTSSGDPGVYSQTNPYTTGPQNNVMTWIMGDLLAGMNIGAAGSTKTFATDITLNGNVYTAGTQVGAFNSTDWFSIGNTLRSAGESVYNYYFGYLQSETYLYNQYAEAMLGVCYRYTKSLADAEDVLQETFLKIWNNFSQYDKTKGKLFTWIVNIARNLAIDFTRSKGFKNQQKNLDVDKIVSFIDSRRSTSFNPDQVGLKKLLDNLKPEQREILDLVYFNGYTQAEVAEELNIPLGTVKTRIRMALIQLRSIV